MIKIEGLVERIIFRNDENGYTVAALSTEEDTITIVGNTPFIKIGDEVSLEGDFVFHPKYMEQFKFEKLQINLPTSISGIKKYLSGGLIPFIGKKTAEKIVEAFGEETLKIIEENPHRLKEIPGIGDKKLDKIIEAFKDQRELRNLLLFTSELGIGTNLNLRIYKKYGEGAVGVIKDNPYRLAQDIRGIGFRKADEIAETLGITKDSDNRMTAGLKYIMMLSQQEGHCYLPKDLLLKRASKLLEVDEESLDSVFIKMTIDPEFYIQKIDNEINCYYSGLFKAETNVAGKLLEIAKYPNKKGEVKVEKEIEEIESRQGIKLDSRQIEAINEAVDNGLLVITGGPGTGKTTTLKAIIEVFESMDLNVSLAAPTGRAAKRMTEATNREALTIHRLLDFSYSEDFPVFNKNQEEPLETDVLIIDEMSMVDISLMNSLLKALDNSIRLILVGDSSQLPSVGAGNVLRDIISSGEIKVVNLDKIFRQAEESMIVKNAHLINKGESPVLNEGNKDFFMIFDNNMKSSAETICNLVQKRLPDFYGVDPFKDIQVLTPMKKGEVGVNNLNTMLQNALNPKSKSKNEINYNGILFREGDRVMQIKNNYQIQWKSESDIFDFEGEGIFNGDMGYIEEIDLEENSVKVRIDDIKIVEYNYSNLDELRLSYVTTIHKSQGSEFPVVIIPLQWAPEMLLTRNLLYTGVTRASKLVVLVGQYKYLEYMINNNKIAQRYSKLDDRIRTLANIGKNYV